MIKIKLNDKKYRYDVFQIVNLFYKFQDISFDDSEFDIQVMINDKMIMCSDIENSSTYVLEDKFTLKEQIKMCLYKFLKIKTKKELPWGIMLGIRPTKIALALLKNDMSEEDIVEYYAQHYFTREDKTRLCIEIAKREQKMVNNEKKKISIYIGMPFCPSRCLYCSFTSNSIRACKNLVKPYLEALKYEIKELSDYIHKNNLKIECVYFGGGTPTSVDDSSFEDILKTVYDYLVKGYNIKEFNVECGRPDSINEAKLSSMKKYSVSRISINPQTMNDKTLNLIGRRHSVEDIKVKYKMAREYGFDNINMDIILGLPGESYEDVLKTCNEIEKLNPDNLTVHGMSIKRGSRLHENILNSYELKVANQDEINLMYKEVSKLAQKLNMKPYYMYRQKNMVGNMENLGYCKQNKEGIYNIEMIEEQQTVIALGADAASKVVFLQENRLERFANVKDVKEYINRTKEMVDRKIQLLETLYKEE